MSRAPWWTGIAAWAGSFVLRLLGASWRIERVGMEAQDVALAGGQRCIYALWHSRLLPLVYTHRGRGAAVLISRHRDGELVAGVVGRLGYIAARGSSTRGGEEGLREMLSLAEAGTPLAITPDGPRGPAERVKPGLVYLASRTGWPVLPVVAAARSAWRLRSWDRFLVPRPFARLVLAYGPPISIPPDLDAAATERWRGEVEAALTSLTRATDQRAGVAV